MSKKKVGFIVHYIQ